MEPIDQLFTEIARKHLFIETLEERKSDSLDFHNVSVWGVERALRAAYQAGVNDLTAMPAAGHRREVRAALETIERAFSSVSNTQNGTQAIITLFGGHDGSLNEALQWRRAARAALADSEGVGIPPANTAVPPIVTVTIRSGLIDDLEATISINVVVEDWDVPDFDTGKRPTRNVWELDGGMSASKAEKLRCLIDND